MKLATGATLAAMCLALSGCPSKTVQESGQVISKASSLQCVTERDMMLQQVEYTPC